MKAPSVCSKEFLSPVPAKSGPNFPLLSECLKCLTPEQTIQHMEKRIPKAAIPIKSLVM